MKRHALFVLALAACLAACAMSEDATPPTPPKSAAEQNAEWQHSAFIDHMHAHADYLDELNDALDDGDLERAKIPAYWLSRHKTVGGLPKDLQPYLKGMRKAARVAPLVPAFEHTGLVRRHLR